MQRRRMIQGLLASGTAMAALPLQTLASCSNAEEPMKLKNNIRQSVCRWTYSFLPLEELCQTVRSIGFGAIDLMGPKDWPILKKHGIDSSMCNGAEISLTEGWNDPKNHATLLKNYSTHIDLVADAGYKNLICFSGNRRGMDDEKGLNNCAEGLKRLMDQADKRGVTLVMELLNSKIDHKDYMCDRSSWGVALCKKIGSPRFKLLYDIYHMQIDEGDVIRTIRDHHDYFAHYHTAGVPGRHEIDENQELFYPAIMKAILDTGFAGYVAQEFIPTGKDNKTKIAALKKAVRTCDI